MRSLLQDARYAFRTFLHSPGFMAIAVLTLALGIGANTAIFTVVHAVLIERLPYRDADRLVVLAEETARRPGIPNVIGPSNLVRWQERAKTFEQIAGYSEGRVNLVGAGAPEEIAVQVVTTNFFDTLGTTPLVGRSFAESEGTEGRNDVAIVSYGLWQRRFGGDNSIIGRSIQLSGRGVQVIGVMPASFSFLIRDLSLVAQPADVWTPFAFTAAHREAQGRYMGAVARLRAASTLEESRAEMRGIATTLEQEFPQFDAGWTVMLRPIREALTGTVRPALIVLTGAVGFVLLIACANVANLLLARGAARQREIAVRRALGASRLRVATQLLTESLALALLGGAAGLLVAEWGLDGLVALSPVSLTELGPIRLNYRVLAFTAAVSMITAVISGLAFALEGSRADVHDAMDGTRQVGVGIGHRRLRNAFVVAEIALAVVLLVGAGLMLRSLARVRAIDPGFASTNVLTARVGLPTRKYARTDQRLGFFRDVIARIRALPGVESVGTISFLPLGSGGAGTGFTVVGRPEPALGQAPVTDVRVSDNGYFEAMRVPLLRGRLFSEREMRENTRVVIINDTLATQHFPGQDPLGHRLDIAMGGPPPRVPTEIIGIVGDVRYADLQTPARPMVYWPHPQLDYSAMTLTVRTASSPLALVPALERAIQSLDAEQPLADIRTMDQWLERSLAARRFNTVLLLAFAGVAVVLAAGGIYGVMSYAVSQRTPEIGLRLALGAHEKDILRMVVGDAIRLSLVGLALGIVLSLVLRRAVEQLLYETRGTDALTLLAVVLLLGAVALIASYLPARRAARIEPVQALRYQ